MEMPPIRGDIEREREGRCERGEMEWGTVPGWKAVSKIAVPAAGIVVVCSSSRHLRRQAQALAQNEFHVVFPLYWCGFGCLEYHSREIVAQHSNRPLLWGPGGYRNTRSFMFLGVKYL